MNEDDRERLRHSAIAINLTKLPPIIFQRFPQELLHDFLPSLSPSVLKMFLSEDMIAPLKRITESDVKRELERAHRAKISVMTLFDDHYPVSLKEIPDPPPVLYLSGRALTKIPKLSIIGPRRPTNYGLDVTHYLLEELSSYEIETVSGLALGIDALVHKESLSLGLSTIAILGTGIDIIYPQSNRQLFQEIEHNGTLLSEFPLHAHPLKYNFPRRNRIIAALGLGTLIIEASPKSGSLITASFARDFGKDVFAVPGNIFNYNSLGTNKLISEGAKPLLNIEDILTERGFSSVTQKINFDPSPTLASSDFGISDTLLKELLNFLVKPKRLENIIDFCRERNYSFTYSLLTKLEIEGLIRITSNNLVFKIGCRSGKKPSNCRISGKGKTN